MMYKDKAWEILRNYKADHEGDFTPDEGEAFNVALWELAQLAQAEQEQIEGEPERMARLLDLQRQGRI
jgi:hypothetical protein